MTNSGTSPLKHGARMALLLLALFLSPLSPALATTVYVSGRVLAGEGPVAGAAVTLLKNGSSEPVDSAQSLQNGGFVLKAPAAGHYTISVDQRAYATSSRPLDLPAGGLEGLTLQLVPRPVIRLRLIGPDGLPVKARNVRASVRPTWDGGSTEGSSQGESDAGGLFSVSLPEALPAAGITRVLISVRAPGIGCAQIYLERWPDAPVEVKLDTGATLSGTAEDAGGKPVKNAPIFMVRVFNDARFVADEQIAFTSTNQDGKFTVPSMLYGAYMVILRTPELAAGPRLVVLSSPETTISLHASPAPPDNPKP